MRLAKSDSGHVQLVFVFSTNCTHCRASLQAWKQIANDLVHHAEVQVLGISTDSVGPTRSFVAEHDIQFPVVSFVDRKLRVLYRSRVIPQTLLLDADGIVTYARLGAVKEDVVIDSVIAQVDLRTGRTTRASASAPRTGEKS